MWCGAGVCYFVAAVWESTGVVLSVCIVCIHQSVCVWVVFGFGCGQRSVCNLYSSGYWKWVALSARHRFHGIPPDLTSRSHNYTHALVHTDTNTLQLW